MTVVIIKKKRLSLPILRKGDKMQDIIVIVGPTGVGKTKLSIELAKKLNAEIINGDSVAIYKDLDIGSAKPRLEERENIPHHLIDIRKVEETYSVFDYQKDVRRIIEEITSRDKRVIIVGGTGLYIKAALYDYHFKEGTTNYNYEELTNPQLLEKIKSHNPEKLPHVNNRRRLIRLLNKLENSEKITNQKDKLLYPIKVIGLTTDRNILYERINKRVEKMKITGLLEEVEGLKDKFSTSRILNSAIGYKEFIPYFNEEKSLEEVLEQIKLNSRRYAKRQYTFFRHQLPTTWINVNFSNFKETIQEVYNKIEGIQ